MLIDDINKELEKIKVNSLSSAIKENLLSNMRDIILEDNRKIKLNKCLDLDNINNTIEELEYNIDEIITNFIINCIEIEEDKCL